MIETNPGHVNPNYNLSVEELRGLETDLARLALSQYGEEGLFGVWSRYDSPYANISRTYEEGYFPEASEVDEDVEKNSEFYLVIDTRERVDKAVHSATVTTVSAESVEQNKRTNMVIVDDLVRMGNFSHADFYDYYLKKGIDLPRCIAVESIFRIGDRSVGKYQGQSIANLAYLACFEKLMSSQPELNTVGVFASINREAKLSFSTFGLEYEPLMGRDDFSTLESKLGRSTMPIFIPLSENNKQLFETIEPFLLPEVKT